jgi:N,N'-diacetyllegionaminate synthase
MHEVKRLTSPVEYCLEIAQSHDGSLGYIDAILKALAQRGIKLVKFQMHLPEFESTADEPFRVELIGQDATRYDYWKRTGFSFEQWQKIYQWCVSLKIEFLCTPLSCEAVDALCELGVERFKVASGDATNWQLIDHIISKAKPTIVSTGLSSSDEIESLVMRFPANFPLTILYCVSKYPASDEDINLHRISDLKSKYPNLKVGFSDHTGNPLVGIAAAHYGAEFVEQHIVFSKEQYGPDTSSSVDLSQAELVQRYFDLLVRLNINSELDLKKANNNYDLTKSVFSRGLSLKSSLKKGDTLVEENVTMKKPLGPLSWDERILVIGKIASRDLDPGFHIRREDFE